MTPDLTWTKHVLLEKKNTKSVDDINLEEVYDLPANQARYFAHVMLYDLPTQSQVFDSRCPFVYSQIHLSNGTRFFNTEYYKNYEFAFKYIEEGKSGEELDENSDGNYSESDGDIDNDNDDL